MGAAAAMMVGGGLVSAYGQLQQGYAAQAAGEYNAQVAEQNAVLSRQQAASEEKRFRFEVKRQLGAGRAAVGSSGIQLEGSALDVLEDSVSQAESDAQNIRYQGELKAWGFESEAKMQRYQGAMGLQGAQFGAAGTLLSAGGKAYDHRAR